MPTIDLSQQTQMNILQYLVAKFPLQFAIQHFVSTSPQQCIVRQCVMDMQKNMPSTPELNV